MSEAKDNLDGCSKLPVVERQHEGDAVQNALPVEPVATLEQIIAVQKAVYDNMQCEYRLENDTYVKGLLLRGMLAVMECQEAVRYLFKQQLR